MRTRVFLALALIVLSAAAVTADPVKFSGSLRTRIENWSFFESAVADEDYTFLGAQFRASAAQQFNKQFDWQLELAVPVLLNLPDHALAPAPQGQLGLGASYFAANDLEGDAASIFPKQAFVRYRNGVHSVRAGRFEFSEGTEVAPKNAMLAQLKNTRVAQRLIGPFGFSHVGRSFDGVHYAANSGSLNFTAAALQPTVGAFDVDGSRQLDDVGLLYGAVTFSRANADERIFVIAYQDERNVVKADNRPLPLRNIDREPVEMITVGGHYLAAFGKFDVLLWGALQNGDWGNLDHKAHAADIEAGYHFGGPKNAALRAGLFRSSGDSNNADGKHETFFQHVPTPRVYARFPFYNAMNSSDTFLQFSMKATPKVTISSELHVLRLNEGADLWYAGGGAFEEDSFGFAGRPGGGNEDLARVIDIGVDHAFNPKMSMTFYAGYARGGDVVESIFDDESARYLYLEFTRRF